MIEQKMRFAFRPSIFSAPAEELIAVRKEINRLANLLVEMRDEREAEEWEKFFNQRGVAK